MVYTSFSMQIIHFLKNKKNITQYFEFAATEFAPAKILETKNDNIKNQSKQKSNIRQPPSKFTHPLSIIYAHQHTH